MGDPVRVEDSEPAACSSDALLGFGLEVASPFVLVDSAISGFAVVDSFLQLLLPGAAPDADAVNDESLFGLVSQVSCFVWSGGLCGAVYNGELPVLPAPDSDEEAHGVGLFLSPQLLQVLEGSHSCGEGAATWRGWGCNSTIRGSLSDVTKM